MYTYVQRPGCKKENMAMYVHTGRVSNAYSRMAVLEQRNNIVVVFMGSQPAGSERRNRVVVVFMGR